MPRRSHWSIPAGFVMGSLATSRVVDRPRRFASTTSCWFASAIADQIASFCRFSAKCSKKRVIAASSAARIRANAACAAPTASAASLRSACGISNTSDVASTTTTASPGRKRSATSSGTSMNRSPPTSNFVPLASAEIGKVFAMA